MSANPIAENPIRRDGRHRPYDPAKVPELTPRQKQVAELIALGKTTKEIAVALNIEVATADVHRANLYEKMGFHSSVDVAHWALATGLIANKFQTAAL